MTRRPSSSPPDSGLSALPGVPAVASAPLVGVTGAESCGLAEGDGAGGIRGALRSDICALLPVRTSSLAVLLFAEDDGRLVGVAGSLDLLVPVPPAGVGFTPGALVPAGPDPALAPFSGSREMPMDRGGESELK